MENIEGKAAFLKNELADKLTAIDPDTKPLWGKMNVQQMIEHMADYIRMGNGKNPQTLLTPEDRLPGMQAFLESEKQFRENTANPLMPDTPADVKHGDVKAAIAEIENELRDMFDVFEKMPGVRFTHPLFGHLNYEESVQLLHKHATHHLRQFGVAV